LKNDIFVLDIQIIIYRAILLLKLLLFFILFLISVFSQDTSYSLAFKKNRPVERHPFFYRPDLSYQILQQFRLIQQANSGDPIAQHELGLRLLFGDGIAADTPSAVNWIRRAASQNLNAAQYNYGLMLLNGIGVEWNPFEAFKYFKNASIRNFAPAQYIVGILYTDNLIVPRDWRQAYYWINKSKSNGYSVEEDILNLLDARLPESFKDSLMKNKISYSNENFKPSNEKESHQEYSSQSLDESIGLSFIDFDIDEKKKSITEDEIVRDLLMINLIKDSSTISIKSANDFINNFGLENLLSLANFDIPEVLTFLGYLHKQGKFLPKDDLKATEYFILAIRYDSHRAPFFLLDLIQNKSFIQSLKSELNNNNTAKFVWYGLARFGFIDEIILKDAYELLNESAKNQHINSINELALNYYVGNYLKKDIEKAVELWRYAENLGSKEATIRILLTKIFDESQKIDKNIINSMLNFEENGSILAQVALGFCYEKGRGTIANKSLAVKYYRKAAQRGNLFAFERLKNLYDSIRPNLSEFRIK